MKTHEKILVGVIIALCIGCAAGWILWAIERGNGIVNFESYRRLGELYKESGIIIEDLQSEIDRAKDEFREYQSTYQREYDKANEALQIIIGENKTSGSKIGRIKATISKLKKLTNYYFDNFGSGGFVGGPLNWTIFEQ